MHQTYEGGNGKQRNEKNSNLSAVLQTRLLPQSGTLYSHLLKELSISNPFPVFTIHLNLAQRVNLTRRLLKRSSKLSSKELLKNKLNSLNKFL